jgi:16S rRNA (guanine966-N2)-methyltransferase
MPLSQRAVSLTVLESMRITGGEFRSRGLRAPRGQGTRPTSDRVREALFSILSSLRVVQGARVLDLYGGTGALALEALSRGADEATIVERAREALDAIRHNVRSLSIEGRTRVIAGDVRDALLRLQGPFDLVLVDPPWALVDTGEVSRVLDELARTALLSPQAVLVLEHSSRTSSPAAFSGGLLHFDTRRYGDTSLSFYRRTDSSAGADPAEKP